MTRWRVLFDDGPVKEYFKYDPVTREIQHYREQIADPIIEVNKAQFNVIDERARWKEGLGDKVASIPMEVIEAYKKRGIDLMGDQKELRKFLNDPDNRLFRTRPGRV